MNPFITHMFQRAPIATDAEGNIYCIRTNAILIPASADFDDPAVALSLAEQIINISSTLALGQASSNTIADALSEQAAIEPLFQQIDDEIATLATQPEPTKPALKSPDDLCPPLAELNRLAIRDDYLDILGLRPMPLQQAYFPSQRRSIYNLHWWLQDDSDPMMPGSRPKSAVDYDIPPELIAHINGQISQQAPWDQRMDKRINAFLSRFRCLNFLWRWDAHLNNWWNRCEARIQNALGNPTHIPPPLNDASRYQLQASLDQPHLTLHSGPHQ